MSKLPELPPVPEGMCLASDIQDYAAEVRRQTVQACADRCLRKHANGRFAYDNRADCHAGILELLETPHAG